MTEGGLKELGYLCSHCKRKRILFLEKDVHLNRHELEQNGLASYIDVHTSKPDTQDIHGMKLYIDANFHVRTNDLISLEQKKNKANMFTLPLPSRKIKELNTRHQWISWYQLELVSQGKLKFVLENRTTEKPEDLKMEFESQLGTIKCTVIPKFNSERESKSIEHLESWIRCFIRALELASDIHVDLIPEVLRFIDINAAKKLGKIHEDIISILIDKASVLIPYKPSLNLVINSKDSIKAKGIEKGDIVRIAKKLIDIDKFTMNEIQTLLDDEILNYSELEEEIIVLAISQLIQLGALDYKLSYLKSKELDEISTEI